MAARISRAGFARARLRRILPEMVLLAFYEGRNRYGEASYSDPRPYPARIEGRQQNVQDADGDELVSSLAVTLEGDVPITQEGQITLPDGTTPPVVAVVKEWGEASIHHTTIYLGSARSGAGSGG